MYKILYLSGNEIFAQTLSNVLKDNNTTVIPQAVSNQQLQNILPNYLITDNIAWIVIDSEVKGISNYYDIFVFAFSKSVNIDTIKIELSTVIHTINENSLSFERWNETYFRQKNITSKLSENKVQVQILHSNTKFKDILETTLNIHPAFAQIDTIRNNYFQQFMNLQPYADDLDLAGEVNNLQVKFENDIYKSLFHSGQTEPEIDKIIDYFDLCIDDDTKKFLRTAFHLHKIIGSSPNFDYSALGIGFCKALEAELNYSFSAFFRHLCNISDFRDKNFSNKPTLQSETQKNCKKIKNALKACNSKNFGGNGLLNDTPNFKPLMFGYLVTLVKFTEDEFDTVAFFKTNLLTGNIIQNGGSPIPNGVAVIVPHFTDMKDIIDLIVQSPKLSNKLNKIKDDYRNQVSHKDLFTGQKYKALFEAVIGDYNFFSKNPQQQEEIIKTSLLNKILQIKDKMQFVTQM